MKQDLKRRWSSNYDFVPGLTNDQRDKELESFLKQVASNTLIWETLDRIIIKMISGREVQVPMADPNWAIHTASNQGYIKALKDIQKLIPRPEV